MKKNACSKTQEALWEAPGGGGETTLPAELREHLDACPDCRRLCEANQRTVDLLRLDVPADPGPEFWTRLSARIMDQVRGEEVRPLPWYKRPWLKPPAWPVYAGAPALALLILVVVWFQRAPVPDPAQLVRNTAPFVEVVSDDLADQLEDSMYSLTTRQTQLLGQKVVAGLARDIQVRNVTMEDAVADWDLSNRLDNMTKEELEKVAKKLQTVGPTGTGEVFVHVS